MNIVNTNGVNGPATDFSSITPVLLVNVSGNYVSGIGGGGSGSGDVVGPASSTASAVTLFDGTTGKLLKNSSLLVNGTTLSGDTLGLHGFNGIYLYSQNGNINLSGTVYANGSIFPNNSNVSLGGASPNSFKNIFAKNFGTDLVSTSVSSLGTYDIDLRNGMSINYDFTGCPSGTVNFTLSNPTVGSAWILTTKQNASGTVSVGWPSSIKWQGGVSGVMTATSGTSPIDMFSLYCSNTSPATYLASYSNNYL